MEAYVLIHCLIGTTEEVLKRLKSLAFIKSIDQVYGLYDIILKMEYESENRAQVSTTIRSCKGVVSTLTMCLVDGL